MEARKMQDRPEVIRNAIQYALIHGKYDLNDPATAKFAPRVIDMAHTGGIPEGFSHFIFVAIDKTGYLVSRSQEGRYNIEMKGEITRPDYQTGEPMLGEVMPEEWCTT